MKNPSFRLQPEIRSIFRFPIVFTRGLFDPENDALESVLPPATSGFRPRLAWIVDQGVAEKRATLPAAIERMTETLGSRVEPTGPALIMPGGETAKNGMTHALKLAEQLLDRKLCRHSVAIVVGGGAVLDAAGLAASLVHRGLRILRVPTTALAQCDSGVGVKYAVNLDGQKNALGVFGAPFAVLNDFDFLDTLSDDEWLDGVAEAFKVALIEDATFFEFLASHAHAIRDRKAEAVERLIVRCAERHVNHIAEGGDPFETGSARPLDFGHWSAHWLERAGGFRIRHGQAVAAGVALDLTYAALKGWITPDELEYARAAMLRCGLKLWVGELARRNPDGRLQLLDGLEAFREHIGGPLCLTFPKGLGRRHEIDALDVRALEQALNELRRRVS